MSEIRLGQAIAKASKARLLADFATAARLLAQVPYRNDGSAALRSAYVLGVVDGTASTTVKACLLTAWGA